MTKKSWPISLSKLLYKLGQDSSLLHTITQHKKLNREREQVGERERERETERQRYRKTERE